MDKLFNDSELFQKERPTTLTEQQTSNFIKELAEEICCNYSSSNEEDVEQDLVRLYPFNNDGFSLAKELDSMTSNADYHIDSEFISFLEDLGFKKWQFIKKNIEDWVKAHDIKPKISLKTFITLKKDLSKDYKAGDTIYINRIYEKMAEYGVSKKLEDSRNTSIAFEKIEENV